jgi:hypothetical protein
MSGLSYPYHKPTVAGYYGVLYNNPEENGAEYAKSLWWENGDFTWRIPNIDDYVTKFYPETHHKYYVPSMELFESITL